MACPILRKLGIPNGGIHVYGGKTFPLIGSLCLVGTCGSGFDCGYPSGRVPATSVLLPLTADMLIFDNTLRCVAVP